jgi:hypothetical protein
MKRAVLVITFTALALILAGCSETPTSTSDTDLAVSDLVILAAQGPGGGGIIIEDLSEEEAAGLIFMREEEKLARDVYLTFFDLHATGIFETIAASEQVHMDRILGLLTRYELEDPVGDNGIGVFSNTELQELYDALIAQGSSDLIEALLVGGAIEEIDILDLVEYIDGTDHADIARVYGRLLSGSENHLRGFVRELDLLGVTYEPQFLSQEAYDEIIGGSSGHQGPSHGHGHGGNGGGNGN